MTFQKHRMTDRVINMYLAGATYARIRDECDVCDTTISTIIKKFSLPKRLGVKKTEIVRLRMAGVDIETIQQTLQCNRSVITRVIRECGL